MKNKKARVLITRDCHRSCAGCCSDYSPAMAGMKPVWLEELANYESVTITGGEPMLYPKNVSFVVGFLKARNPNIRIYLYTTLGSNTFCRFIEQGFFDGITYTLHTPIKKVDIDLLANVQDSLNYIKGDIEGSWRLKLEPNITIDQLRDFKVDHNIWTSVEVIEWLDDGNCPIGEGEDLLYLTEETH